MKLVIADDHTLFRDTLVEYIKRNMRDTHIRAMEDFYAVETLLEVSPEQDLVMLDLRMPGMKEMQGIKKLRESYPDLKIALMSGLAEPNDVRQAVDLGVRGYFPKTLKSADFIKGIELVASGKKYIPVDDKDNQIRPSYFDDEDDNNEASSNYSTASDIPFTEREKDVLKQLLKGKVNKEIAYLLGVQEVTVKLHIRGICQKLNVQNRTQAALKARELGFME